MSVAREDGTTSDYRKQVSVYFSRQIDGVDVVGPGSRMIVHLGSHGELAGLIRRWSETEAEQEAVEAFIPTGEVLPRMEAQLNQDWHEASEIAPQMPRRVIYDDGHSVVEAAYATDGRVPPESSGTPRVGRKSRSVASALEIGRAGYAQQEKATDKPLDLSQSPRN